MSRVTFLALLCGSPGCIPATIQGASPPGAGADTQEVDQASNPFPDLEPEPDSAPGPERDPGVDTSEPPTTEIVVSQPTRVTLRGGSGTAFVDAPPDAHSFIAVLDGPSFMGLGPDAVVDPLGQTVMSWERGLPTRSSSYRYGFGTCATLLPMSRTTPPVPGEYEIHVFTDGADDLEISVQTIAKVGRDPEAADPDGRTVELDVVHHFVSLPDLPAASASRDPDFAIVLDELEEGLGMVGIAVRSTEFDAIEEESLSSIDSLGPGSEFERLLALSPDGRALHLYWVEQISDGSSDAFVILGMAGAIGGPATIGGTSQSGVAIATLDLRYDPRTVGTTAVHEVLHFLGLYHTTESCAAETEDCLMASADPLDDTPSCPAGRDRNRDGYLDVEECADLDGHNMMFWLADPEGPALTLTSEQAEIVRRNPLTY